MESHPPSKVVVNVKKFACDFCSSSYSEKKNLTRHVKESHDKENQGYRCEEEGYL